MRFMASFLVQGSDLDFVPQTEGTSETTTPDHLMPHITLNCSPLRDALHIDTNLQFYNHSIYSFPGMQTNTQLIYINYQRCPS